MGFQRGRIQIVEIVEIVDRVNETVQYNGLVNALGCCNGRDATNCNDKLRKVQPSRITMSSNGSCDKVGTSADVFAFQYKYARNKLQHHGMCGAGVDDNYRADCFEQSSLRVCKILPACILIYYSVGHDGIACNLQRFERALGEGVCKMDVGTCMHALPSCGREPAGMNTYPSASKRPGEGGIDKTGIELIQNRNRYPFLAQAAMINKQGNKNHR